MVDQIDVTLIEKLIYDSKLTGVIDAWKRIFQEVIAENLKPLQYNSPCLKCLYVNEGCNELGVSSCSGFKSK